jgi:hypothetical protein
MRELIALPACFPVARFMTKGIPKTNKEHSKCSVMLNRSNLLPQNGLSAALWKMQAIFVRTTFDQDFNQDFNQQSSSPVSQASTSSTAPGLSGPVAYFDSASCTWMMALPGTAVTAALHSSNSSRDRTRKPSSMLGSSSAIPSLRTRRVWQDAMSSGVGFSGRAGRVE